MLSFNQITQGPDLAALDPVPVIAVGCTPDAAAAVGPSARALPADRAPTALQRLLGNNLVRLHHCRVMHTILARSGCRR